MLSDLGGERWSSDISLSNVALGEVRIEKKTKKPFYWSFVCLVSMFLFVCFLGSHTSKVCSVKGSDRGDHLCAISVLLQDDPFPCLWFVFPEIELGMAVLPWNNSTSSPLHSVTRSLEPQRTKIEATLIIVF